MRPYGPLRGREEFLAGALAVVRRTRVHRASGVVLISGDAGIGKTAVLSEICRQAAHVGIRVARSKCDEIEQAWPGAPIVGLLRTGRDPLVTAAEFERITALTGDPLLLVDHIADHLDQLAAENRLLVAVDDVQWADRVSRYALRALITRLVGRPVVWVLASRSDRVGLDVSGADLVEVEHIRLEPLARRDIAEIARDRLGSKLNGHVAALLEAAGGNAFLATQIIDGVARAAEMGRDDEVPTEFRAAVSQRLEGLPSTARQIISTLAVAGRPVSIVELPTLCGTSLDPMHDDASASVVRTGLVTSNGAELAFSHDLIRETIYALTAPEVRRQLHARLALHFLDAASDPVLAAMHARAAVSVGDETNARIMLAGAEALVGTNAVDAANLALQAFQALRPGQSHWLQLGEQALSVLSRTQRASGTIAVADRLLATVGDVEVMSRIETHVMKAMWLSGRFTDIVDRAERGIALTVGHPELSARFQAARALANTQLSQGDRISETTDAALTQARAAGDYDALAFALQAAGEVAHNEHRHLLALKNFRELRSVTRRPYLAEEILELQLLDRYQDAQILLDAAQEDSHAKSESLVPDLLFAQAKQHYNLGHLGEADQTAAVVIDLGQVIGNSVQVVESALIRAYVALLRGEPAVAEQRLALARTVDSETAVSEHPGVTFTSGWVTAQRGEIDTGRQILSRLLAASPELPRYWAWWPCWAAVLFEVGTASCADDFTERVVEVAEESARRNPDVATLTGLALNMRGLFSQDLAMVAESVKILQHSPRIVVRAAGIEGYGTMLLEDGERDAGLVQLDAAWDGYNQMGAVARRARVQRVMRQAGARRAKWVSEHHSRGNGSLTEAERRVAHLIATGHTNKSAAKSLGVSVNTVGTHVRSAYVKLGVQSRVQLANVLRERGELD
jgi:DNA-binding CsgD family transcriptional regulator/tetratricopeptide (TPR) repeat protein